MQVNRLCQLTGSHLCHNKLCADWMHCKLGSLPDNVSRNHCRFWGLCCCGSIHSLCKHVLQCMRRH
jgi:hypothetical protein